MVCLLKQSEIFGAVEPGSKLPDTSGPERKNIQEPWAAVKMIQILMVRVEAKIGAKAVRRVTVDR